MSETKHGPVMTLEADWAERKAREVAHSLPPSDFGSHRAIMAFAAALREAVKAEREACLRIIEHPNAGLEPPDGGDPTPDEMLANIAADIRERPL